MFLTKKKLYLNGKKTYNYNYPKSPFPPSKFFNDYVINETDYRLKKSEAFKKRIVSNQARNWLMQRNAFAKQLVRFHNYTQEMIKSVLISHNVQQLSQQAISSIITESLYEDMPETELKVQKEDEKAKIPNEIVTSEAQQTHINSIIHE